MIYSFSMPVDISKKIGCAHASKYSSTDLMCLFFFIELTISLFFCILNLAAQLSLFVNIPDCIIRSNIKELFKISEERGKLKGAITEIEHIIATIYAKKLATTDHARDKPKTGHQCNAIIERQATYDEALLWSKPTRQE